MNVSRGKNWLMTGGCGFIGTNLIHLIVRNHPSHRIRILDNLYVGPREGIDLVIGDIRDYQTCLKACAGVDVVVHLAALPGVAPSLTDPRADFETNVLGTFNMLEAARQQGVQKFVFASSGAPLGNAEPPVHEETVAKPVSPYGAGKLSGEGYCHAYDQSYSLNTVILRFSNVYGPHSSHKKSVIPTFFKKALQGEPLTIYGDGTQSRDFIFVGDLVQAILLSVETPVHGEIFQIATNVETSINEIASRIQVIFKEKKGERVQIRYEDGRAGEVKKFCVDTSKAKRVIGFVPKVGLDKGLNRTFDYFATVANAGYKEVRSG